MSKSGDCLIGYVRSGSMAIVAGAPICSLERLADGLREWEAEAARQGLSVCYFGAEDRLQSFLADDPAYTSVVLGCQPDWTPSHFLARLRADRSLRAQLHRAHNKGVVVQEWTDEQARNHPQLRAVLDDWLRGRGLPTLHFLVEPQTLSDLRDRRIFVASRKDRVVGFVTLCPAPARNGWLTEQFVRAHDAPNGTVELALYHAIEAITDADFVTMGIVPLSQRSSSPHTKTPAWLAAASQWARAHGNRFYNFQGLDAFKSKFHPDAWQPVVVIVKDRRFRLKHLRAIAAAFTQTTPELALLGGLGRAIRSEFRGRRPVS